MSSEVKQLILVVEGTASLGPYWQTIVSDYLQKIIRSFCGIDLNPERNPVPDVELSMVIFNCHGPSSDCLVQRSGWTRDAGMFLQLLSSKQFRGGGFNEVATAEGLAEALKMFSPPSSQAQPSNDFKRHCILITASNPHPLPTPVFRPQSQTVERNENASFILADAKTVASYFSKLSVSLSVVCPRQLLKIRELYNAAKLDQQSVDLSIDTVKNTFYLVLISENFVEARAALSHSATQAIPSIQTSSASPVSKDKPSGRANVNLLNNLSAALSVAMHMSNKISTGMATSLHPSETVFSSRQQGITSKVPASVGQSPDSNNFFSPQTTSNVASNLGVSQTRPWMNQGSPSRGQMMQGVISMTQNMMSALGQGNVSDSGIGGMMPTPEVGQQATHLKIWEGNLSGLKKGKSVLITRLKGYRSASASDSLAANWPPTIQISHLRSMDSIKKTLGQYVGQSDVLMFRAMVQHQVLGQLQDRKLCAVIKLPSQTLLLSVSDDVYSLIGMLFPGHMAMFEPQIPNQQQQQLQQQHQQQLQQQHQHQLSQLQHHQQQQQQQTSPLNQMQQQTSPLNQMQQQAEQMVGLAVMGGQAFAQSPGRSQQGGGGGQQPTKPGAGFMP